MKFASVMLFIVLILQSCYVYQPMVATPDKPVPPIKEQIKPSKYYEINTAGETIKIESVRWENDSLVYKPMRKEELNKVHLNQIQSVNHRSFSRGRSDAITFATYGVLGAGIYFLLQ